MNVPAQLNYSHGYFVKFPHTDVDIIAHLFLGGLSLHLNHLIASRTANYDWPFGTLPFGLFWLKFGHKGP